MPKTRYFHAHETARFDALDGLPLASFKRRALAIGIDFVCLLLIKTPFWLLRWHRHGAAAVEGSYLERLLEQAVEQVKSFLESALLIGVAFKLGKGQTPGKWLMKIKVLSLTHHELGWWQSIERALGYGASGLELGFGFFQYYLNRNRMTVHDRIAETIVVDLRKPRHEAAVHPRAAGSDGHTRAELGAGKVGAAELGTSTE